jgi:DNA mismatch repair protein MutS2
MTSVADSEFYETLEWSRFIDLAQDYARSIPGKQNLADQYYPEHWAANIASARQMQQETQELMGVLDRDALWGPLTELQDPEEILDRLDKSAVLEVQDLVVLRGWLYAIDSWVQIPRDEIRGDRFKKSLTLLSDPSLPLRSLERVLTPEGELSEKASVRFSTLSSEIRFLKREIGNVMERLMKTYSSQGVLQEDFTDVRDGRYVLPVKISSQNEIDGIIYEASASRQTVFVEPREVAELNNRLSQRKNELIQEVFVILEAISRAVQVYSSEIRRGFMILGHWDAVQAKARIGQKYSGKPIRVSEDRFFSISQTAHPLLWWTLPIDSIIRNDVEFGYPARALLITGPNTGGKTVLLKTLGLAGICARTGFLFPAADTPVIPFFDSFFVDVGDSQSIEANISSFSGHVLRFKEILNRLSKMSLILLDELNSATDPEEGAALGRAVLETLMGQEAMIVSTTHDPYLKALSVTDSRIAVASMAFDDRARTPTFKMILGVAGRSRALETAERLGIPLEIIDLARSYLSKGHSEFERMLSKLQSDSEETARARKEAVALREEAERLKKEWTERSELSVKDTMDRVRQRLRRITDQAQDEVRILVRKLDEMKNRRDLDQARGKIGEVMRAASASMDSALREEAPDLAQSLATAELELQSLPTEPSDVLVPGMTVRIPRWKTTGTVLEVNGHKVKVSVGTLQMTLNDTDVEILKGAKPAPARFKVSSQGGDGPVPPEKLDLRGVRLDEAMSLLESYLDQSFRSGFRREVTVVHGLGTGALREGAHKLLSSLPYIKSFRDGGAGNGGAGATIVEFDHS